MHNTENELTFAEQSVEELGFQDQIPEVEGSLGAFVSDEGDIRDKTEVIILTTSYVLRGKIALIPGARLTDYIVESKPFIAVTEVEVKDRTGKLILTSPFLNVNRDLVEIILPAELAVI